MSQGPVFGTQSRHLKKVLDRLPDCRVAFHIMAKQLLPIDSHVMACARDSGGLWAKVFCSQHVISRYQLDTSVRRLKDLGYLKDEDPPHRVPGWVPLAPTGTW